MWRNWSRPRVVYQGETIFVSIVGLNNCNTKFIYSRPTEFTLDYNNAEFIINFSRIR